jgi:hypothetical protein
MSITVVASAAASAPPGSRSKVSEVRKAAHTFRGGFLQAYGRLEHCLVTALVAAVRQPAYHALVSKPPHLLGQRLDLACKLAAHEGPWQATLRPIIPRLEQLKKLSAIRNALSHGALDIAFDEQDQPIYIFRTAQPDGDQVEETRLTLKADETRSIHQDAKAHVDHVVSEFKKLLKVAPPPVRVAPQSIRLKS